MKTNSTMLGLVTSLKMMMFVDVILQIVLPNSYSTIPGALAVKGQFGSVGEKRTCSSHFDFCRFENVLFRFPVPWSLPKRWCLSVSVNTPYMKLVHTYISLWLRRVVVDVEMHDVVQVSNPCIRPIVSKLRFPVSLVILPSVPE